MTTSTQTPLIPWFLVAVAAVVGAVRSAEAQAWPASGTVKSSSGAALAGVLVAVKDSSSTLKATTDASGRFTIGVATSVGRPRPTEIASAQVVGRELVVRSPEDGPLDLALVDASGRRLWNSVATVREGVARVGLPEEMRRGAIFLRIGQAGRVRFQAVGRGSDGVVLAPAAGRSQATWPVLVFQLSGYLDTTFALTGPAQTGISVVMTPAPASCALPATFKWKDNSGGAIVPPGNGWVSIKDFTSVVYNGQHIVYMSTHDQSAYGSATMNFASWSAAATAPQTKMSSSTVAPELVYFTPKKTWVLSYQWCGAKFCYGTSTNPTSGSSWSLGKPLLTEDIVKSTTGPIDQVVICDATTCYLFYAGDNGHIYRASMPIGNFPGTFTGSTSIMQDTQANLFEAVEVYTIKGTGKYLMIVECMGGGGRFFRAFTATSLGGAWTAIPGANTEASPFAGRRNVTFGTAWTNDISHGDLVRTHDETRTIDPCDLQLIYQGYNPTFSGAYDLKPYKMGLLTFTK